MSTALKVLIRQIEDDRNELEEKFLNNIKKLVMPHLDKLKKGALSKDDMENVRILEVNMCNIVSPLINKLSSKYINLTHKELQVANYIKEGKTSKEISELLHISIRAIDIHRYKIRQKLGLNKKRVNLHIHLNSP
jgi:DNA-binding CsgD family transcriptional regulator